MILSSAVRALAFRVLPGQDLRQELLAIARREGLQAGAIVTSVGSLTRVALRYANRKEVVVQEGHFEIVSLVGTLGLESGHLHLCVANDDGVTFGGHVLDGCVVYTTAEVVIAELTEAEFRRESDPTTGHSELVVDLRRSP